MAKYILKINSLVHVFDICDTQRTIEFTHNSLGNQLLEGDIVFIYYLYPLNEVRIMMKVDKVVASTVHFIKLFEVYSGVSNIQLNEDLLSSIDDSSLTLFQISEENFNYIINRLMLSLHFNKKETLKLLNNEPLQKIFYGAPGTGKSYKTNDVVRDYPGTIRTTFHPDTDYASFVGTYKPTKEWCDVVASKIVTDPNTNLSILNTGTFKEDRITYKFVQQAFLKAYILAWKKMSEAKIEHASKSVNVESGFTLKEDDYEVVIKGVRDDNISYQKSERKAGVEKLTSFNYWKSCWNNDNNSSLFQKPSTADETKGESGRSLEWAVCRKIYSLSKEVNEFNLNESKESYNSGLALLEKNLMNGKEVVCFSGKDLGDENERQKYILLMDNESVIIYTENNYKKETASKHFNEEGVGASGVQKTICKHLIEISKSVDKNESDDREDLFEKVYDNFIDEINAVDRTSTQNVLEWNAEKQYLVIEEINRGNCAQIFGDLFQLLDRKNGFTEYPVETDDDIRRELYLELSSLTFDDKVKEYINNLFVDQQGNQQVFFIGKNDSGVNVKKYAVDAIKNGKILVLPCNLYILATMNTSDQSLFPMDSAFKRRWEWEYMPIEKGKDKEGKELDWKIEISGGKTEDWWKFLQKINDVIYDLTKSEDKQLGFFFCKPDKEDGCTISAEKFVNKVIFYLWSDVFKDYDYDVDCCKVKDNKVESKVIKFSDFHKNRKDSLEAFFKSLMKKDGENQNQTSDSNE